MTNGDDPTADGDDTAPTEEDGDDASSTDDDDTAPAAEDGDDTTRAARRRADAADAAAELLDGAELVVVSNRQPYSHGYEDGEPTVSQPPGGLTAALDPVMQAIGGTWIAWGDGEADREVAPDGVVRVPPEDPAYDLRRVWLSDEQVEGYYLGYSNRTLWPLCHSDLTRATFDRENWRHYREVNGTFASAVEDACDGDAPVVWLQDYHLALAPREIRRRLSPAAFLLQFWHIPWPERGVFRACPRAGELLDGLLANDLLGFHTDRYCRNFLDCVAATLDARVDRASGTVRYRGERTTVRSFPLGVDALGQAELGASDEATEFWSSFVERHGLSGVRVGIGVDRLDYTKGIVERLDGLAHLWETRPEWRGELTFVQKGTESRSSIPAYRRVQERVEERVTDLNDRFGTDDWQPVVYLTDVLSPEALAGLYRAAEFALVTPIRDGMNLVSKEFLAAGGDGTLVLSELTGAAEELGDEALLVNPHDAPAVATAVEEALTAPSAERRRRARRLRERLRSEDTYAWMNEQFRAIRTLRRDRADEATPR